MKVKHSSQKFVRFSAVALILIPCILRFPLITGRGAAPARWQQRDTEKVCDKTYARLNFAMVTEEQKTCLKVIKSKLSPAKGKYMTIVIDGHRDSSERVGISLTRANNARDYLVNDLGIDAMSIVIRNFGNTCPADRRNISKNRRIQAWLVSNADPKRIDASIAPLKGCPKGARIITTESPAIPSDLPKY